MSFVTNFNFKAFATDLRCRDTMQNKNSFGLSLLSSEDMERMSVVDVSCRLNDHEVNRSTPWAPKTVKKYPGVQWPTFWDTRMGNFDQRTFPTQRCSTCNADDSAGGSKMGNERCQGHFGTIRMPRMFPSDAAKDKHRVVVYNPHLFEELEALLQAECFCCHRFRVNDFDVQRYVWALLFVDFGLIGEALKLLDDVSTTRGQLQKGKRQREPNERIIGTLPELDKHAKQVLSQHGISESDIADALTTSSASSKKRKTLAAQDVRNELVKQALKELKEAPNDCQRCHSFSPRVTSKDSQFFFHFGKKSCLDFNVESGTMAQSDVTQWERENIRHKRTRTYYNNNNAQEHIRQLCCQESTLMSLLFPNLGQASITLRHEDSLSTQKWHQVFFLDRLLVPPLPLRLSSGVQVQDSGAISPDPKTKLLDSALGFVEQVEAYYHIVRSGKVPSDAQEIANEMNLRNLQLTVNESYTQVLESFAKKEGLFRMHMMGKRVNQACRSVISPDYLVEPNVVLLPRPFARSLSFPEQIVFYSPARAAFLKQCIINGPKKYPGATHVEHRLANGEVRIIELTRTDETVRRQTAERIFAQAQQQKDAFIVHRHVVDDDRAIFNRQPTLHKPSMMGYRIKVLSGLKTLRFHYVNGKSYNADFDGDEMNIHIPQSLEAKAELECIMDANRNFLVPTSGKPIRGLIQDHVAAGVLLTVRDKFLDRVTFIQFLYFGLFPYLHRKTYLTSTLPLPSFSEMVPMPAVFKPKPLWTGKQLISVIVRFVSGVWSEHTNGPSLKGTSLIQPSAYAHTDLKTGKSVTFKREELGDDRVVFLNGELLCGAICKNQLGPSNMSVAHIINELYGPDAVGDLFGALGRILTLSLQREGFSMGVDDMYLTNEPRRTELLRQLDEAPLALPDTEAAAMAKIQELSTALQKEYVPGRMLVPFPKNQLLMMTVSGAKGSNTNTIQMALGLGQQLFDGQRVKHMNSGKTLPGFFIGERRARSFGYAMGRFASGIRPPEYTIHAMAGRDGLIDTAVKTSRSGHLQRCLIKGLESITVMWDRSVRDSNGAVIQFTYGGDGLDSCKASTLTSWDMVKENHEDLQVRLHCLRAPIRDPAAAAAPDQDGKRSRQESAASPDGRRSAGFATGGGGDDDDDLPTNDQREMQLREAIAREAVRNPLPNHLKSSINKYVDTKADIRCFQRVSHVAKWNKQGVLSEKLQERRKEYVEYFKDVCEEITTKRRIRAYSEVGEPVGLLAAQAAGEPSTQMTLNTFHSAGSTVTHVTEGIPRLRELLIYASVQKVAVVIPVEKATPTDEEALSRIMKAAVPVMLTDCLAPIPFHRNIKLCVHRSDSSTEINIALLFSKELLRIASESMCMNTQEHLGSFTAALKQLVKSIVNVLRGRAANSADRGKAATNTSVDDPAALLAADELNDQADDVSDDDESIDDEGDVSQPQSPLLPAAAETAEDADGMDLDMGDDDAAARKDTDAADNEEEDDGGDASASASAAASAASGKYSSFAPITCSYGSGKFRVTIQAVPRRSSSALNKLPKDFFVTKIRIVGPPNVVAVIPDLIQTALTTVTFPTWLPQFEKVHFSRSSDDRHNGELWFQGKGTTIRAAVNIVSMFAVDNPSIKIHKARSTDINDMANHVGIESAYHSLYDELNKLFKRYAVDPRHMSLVADAATHRGHWENYNFTGVISRSASPLFQMTFASSKRFLHTAVTRGIGDNLQSISSAIMVGEKPKVGTATVQWFHDSSMLQDVFERTYSAGGGAKTQ